MQRMKVKVWGGNKFATYYIPETTFLGEVLLRIYSLDTVAKEFLTWAENQYFKCKYLKMDNFREDVPPMVSEIRCC